MEIDENKIARLFDFWCKKLRVYPHWDIRLEFGDNKELSYGRCKNQKSYNELFEGLKKLE